MKLVVCSKHSLAQLEKWIVEMFTPIQNLKIERPIYTEKPFQKENLQKMLKIQPLKEKKELKIIWVLENMQPFYKNKPD